MIRFIILINFYLLLMLTSCQDVLENPQHAPSEFNFDDRYGEYIDTTIYAYNDTFIVNDRISTGGFDAKNSIGSYEGFAATTLLKFGNLPDSSITLDSVYLHFTPSAIFGTGTGQMEIGLYDVNHDWDEHANTDDYWHDPEQMDLITTIIVNPDDSTQIIIPFNYSDLLIKWQKARSKNLGLYLKAHNNTEYIMELSSFGDQDINKVPRLTFNKLINDTTVYYDSTYVGFDASIYDYNRIGSENIYEVAQTKNDLLISSGVAAQSILQFDIKSVVPSNALIHKANLVLHVNDNNIIDESPGNILDNPNHAGNFYILYVKDFQKMQIDSSYINLMNQDDDVLDLDDRQQQIFGRTVIQTYINDEFYFEGFYIKYGQEGQDISVKRLYGISNPEFIPSLRIQYYRIDRPGL